MILVVFLLSLAGFAAVGLSSVLFARGARSDYLLASSSMPPWLVGLSAVATNNSGYMFIGVIGYTYSIGLPATWLMVGWILGDMMASQFVHARLRQAVASHHTSTFAGVLAGWDGGQMRLFRRIAGAVTVVFLGSYAAAQLMAGSKALTVLFGWQTWMGATLSAMIVLGYCWAGGLRASIWTDAAQSFVMLFAMSVLLGACLLELGGPGAAWSTLVAVEPGYMSLWPGGATPDGLGPGLLFIIGWLFAGFSVVGQPHIMVRFMALDDAAHTNRARLWYYAFFIVFYAAANGVGLMSRVILPPETAADPELALPMLALELLPEFMVGIILAGVFAAAMSTADSLVLSCSASLSEDFRQGEAESLFWTKGATVLVTLLALFIAVFASQSVFGLVVVSWSLLGAAFGPLLLVNAIGYRPGEWLSIGMVAAGASTVLIAKQIPAMSSVYEGMPGILVAFAVFAIFHALQSHQSRTAEATDPG